MLGFFVTGRANVLGCRGGHVAVLGEHFVVSGFAYVAPVGGKRLCAQAGHRAVAQALCRVALRCVMFRRKHVMRSEHLGSGFGIAGAPGRPPVGIPVAPHCSFVRHTSVAWSVLDATASCQCLLDTDAGMRTCSRAVHDLVPYLLL